MVLIHHTYVHNTLVGVMPHILVAQHVQQQPNVLMASFALRIYHAIVILQFRRLLFHPHQRLNRTSSVVGLWQMQLTTVGNHAHAVIVIVVLE